MQTINDLKQRFVRPGQLEWIGMASRRLAAIESVSAANVAVGTGIEGEHHASGIGNSKRQVTIIQHEHLPAIARLSGRETVAPELLRRNLVVSGINLVALKDKRFRIGEVLLEGTGPCAPCSRMEENLGPGGYNAMRGHGGITCVVLEAGWITVGNEVTYVETRDTVGDSESDEEAE